MKVPAAVSVALVLACGSITFPDRQPTIAGEIVGLGLDVPFSRGDATKL